ncbi:MAG: DUF2892 domain-containing protein [Gammaproteobacteria bacterium]|nr:DUF2892 domain-containing protein [Gammaproteobacteria bacterium]
MDDIHRENLFYIERIFRVIIGIVCLPIAFTILPNTTAFVLLISLSLYLLHTALLKWDPFYFFIEVTLRLFTLARIKIHAFGDNANVGTYA